VAEVQTQASILYTWIERFSNRLKARRFEKIHTMRQRRKGAAFFIPFCSRIHLKSSFFAIFITLRYNSNYLKL
jgi:hypothetical protein